MNTLTGQERVTVNIVVYGSALTFANVLVRLNDNFVGASDE